jgi:hypothetical protein
MGDHCPGNDGWVALNDNGHADYRGSCWQELDDRPIGFALAYGTKNADEDQATVAQRLLCEHKRLTGLARSDRVLAAKIRECKAYFRRWSGGRMDDHFWADLEGALVDAGYWGHPTSAGWGEN